MECRLSESYNAVCLCKKNSCFIDIAFNLYFFFFISIMQSQKNASDQVWRTSTCIIGSIIGVLLGGTALAIVLTFWLTTLTSTSMH